MSAVKTFIQNFRFARKVETEKNNAGQTTVSKSLISRTLGVPMAFAAGFVAMLSALAPNASAAIDLNATIGPILDGVSALVPSIVNLIVSIVPAIIVLAVVGFIVAFLDKILSMLHL